MVVLQTSQLLGMVMCYIRLVVLQTSQLLGMVMCYIRLTTSMVVLQTSQLLGMVVLPTVTQQVNYCIGCCCMIMTTCSSR